MLLHGLCDFYNLRCHSYTNLEGKRVTSVKRRWDAKGGGGMLRPADTLACTEFLQMCAAAEKR
eukprot:2734431-Pyramimonas_sp.AAC.1